MPNIEGGAPPRRGAGERQRSATESRPLPRREISPLREPRGPDVDPARASADVFEAANLLLQMKRSGHRRQSNERYPHLPSFGSIGGVVRGASTENCYLYAIDRVAEPDIEGYPGQLAQSEPDIPSLERLHGTAEGLTETLRDDGLVPVGDVRQALSGHRLIVAYYKPANLSGDGVADYHFARMDADGGWSEKFGDMEPERLDRDPGAPHETNFNFMGYFAYDPNAD